MGRRLFTAAALVVALLLVTVWLQQYWFSDQSEPRAVSEIIHIDKDVALMAKASPAATLKDMSGQVERRDEKGEWRPLRVGQALQVNDVIRTAANGRAVLMLGDNVVVDVAEATTLSIQQVSATLSRVTLDDGRVVSKVNGKSDFRFRVEIRSSKAVAETDSGEFGVLKRGAQPATVAAKSGSVELRGQGGRVQLRAGEMSSVSAEAGPAKPSKIPNSLFLKFAPTLPLSNKKSIELKGTTSPGASLVVAGKRTTVDGTGNFSQRVALTNGENEILVTVEDSLGRHASASPKIAVRAGPKVQGEVQW